MLKRLEKKSSIVGILAAFLLMVAPIIVTSYGSVLFWGEEECPECLKK